MTCGEEDLLPRLALQCRESRRRDRRRQNEDQETSFIGPRPQIFMVVMTMMKIMMTDY